MSTRTSILTLAGSLLCASALRAAEAPAAKTEPPVEPYQLKNRSTFVCSNEAARAPFWPIGWVHRTGTMAAAVKAAAAPRVLLDPNAFKVTSILLGSGSVPSLAVINGRAYSEGEFIRVPRGVALAVLAGAAKTATTPPVVRTRVQRINDGSVVLQREEQAVTVALQRPELVQRKTEEPLLDDER